MIIKFCLVFPQIFLLHKVVRDAKKVEKHCCSGFTFSHYDLLFPTRYCIPYVRSGLYQLVICVKGIRVCELHWVCAWPRFALRISVLSMGVDTTLSGVELGIDSAWTTRAGLHGWGARGNFYWRAHRTSFMTSSYVKVTFSLIRKVPVCFFR